MRLVVLDRDGVINHDSDAYIKSPEEWLPIAGSLEAIARLCRADYKVIVCTNQSGIARKLLSMDTLNKIHLRMLDRVRHKGGEIDAIFFCPHGPDSGCECRKPKPGMLLELAERLKVNLTAVPTVGDSVRDLQAAHAVHALPVLVRTGKGSKAVAKLAPMGLADTAVYDDLSAFVDSLLAGELDERMSALLQPAETKIP